MPILPEIIIAHFTPGESHPLLQNICTRNTGDGSLFLKGYLLSFKVFC